MKRLFLPFVFILIQVGLFAQTPHSFKYQAVLRNADGQVRASEEVSVRIALLRDAADGTQVFQETHTTSTNAFGLIHLEIGSISSLAGINWSGHTWFLQVSVDNVVMGTSQLMSVPYALHALTSADRFSGDYQDLVNTPNLNNFLTQEEDPFFMDSPAGSITDEHISLWNEAHSWGDHSEAGYLWLETPAAGEMAWFDGENWQKVQAGETGQGLTFCYGKPQWGPCPDIAEVTTATISNITMNTATGGGTVISEGDAPVTSRGVCYSTSENPTLQDNCTTDGEGTGTFISQMAGLTPGMTYYVRAYATNQFSTAYGDQVSFTTADSEVELPQIEFNGTLFIHPTDNSASLRYGPTNILIQADSDTDGQSNTTAIVAALGDYNNGNYAAKLCDELEAFGYSDWYLPAKDELNAMYLNMDDIGGFATSGAYYSSTEANTVNAYNQYFNTGYSGSTVKTNNFRVRCVRRD